MTGAIGELVVDTLTPLTLEVTLAVHQELQVRFEQADQQRYKAVERAQYESDLARRRYMRVEPENRLVADSLEADWNEKLRTVTATQEHYEQQRAAERLLVDEQQRAQIMHWPMTSPRYGMTRLPPTGSANVCCDC